jgi:DegT/DnrJ/EryC1/StrS aminotransferase family
MIRVLPMDAVGARVPPYSAAPAVDPLAWAAHTRFMPSGRSALDAVLRSLELDPADDVLISNSSGQTYISACVTCIVFNHCRPSRVITSRTRAIVVIHEFGYPHPRLGELIEIARARQIPLIEDCAHSLDSSVDGTPLGSFGDFAIFSLSKVLPVTAGGVLVSAAPERDLVAQAAADDADAEVAYRRHVPALPDYSHRRRRNYAAVRNRFPDLPLLLSESPGVTPFYVGLVTSDAPRIKRRSSAIEWGSTLCDDLLLVTTNPFVEPDELVVALESAFEERTA